MAQPAPIVVEVSPGELWDKITILRIKADRITDATKIQNVKAELAMLELAASKACAATGGLSELVARLSQVNTALWDVEDEIRDCERRKDFGLRFIELARSVYQLNDERGKVKREVNQLLGARMIEEKQYAKYD